MFKKFLLIFIMSLVGQFSYGAGGSHWGLNAGFGFPYLSQFGLNYVHSSNRFSAEVSYNSFGISVGDASLTLTKPELSLKWHPFAGSFFLGVGVGQQTLISSAEDTLTGQKAEIKVTSMTVTPMLGWMWGVVDGGFFAGMDIGMQTPSGAETTVTSDLPTTNESYQDAVDAGEKYGEASFPVMTFLRLGYLF